MQTVVSPTAPSITPSTTNSPTVYLNRVRTRSPMMSSSSGSPIMTSTIEDQTTIATEEQTNTPTTIIQSHSPKCQGSNPSTCGCSSVRQTDYRGTINTTTTGKSCIPWEDTKFYQPNDYPNAALDMNYCRNPDWSSTSYCYISEYDWEECNVPSCEELIPSSYPSISFHPTLSTLPRSSMATNESLLSSTTTSNCIEVNITYDDYPIETSWDLYRIDTGDSELIQSHTASDGDTFYSKSICLADGEYKFTIYDTDGICCDDYGDGNYTILSEDDGVVIAKGGDFELSESILFLMPYIPYPSMSPSVSNRPTMTNVPSENPSITVIPTVHPSFYPSKPDVVTESSSYPTTRSIIQSVSPSESFHPTLSSLPTSSLSPTLGPQCQGSNPSICGCDSV